LILFSIACNTTDDTITPPPSNSSSFDILWKTQTTPVLPDNILKGIVVNKLGRNYLYVSGKLEGIRVQ